MSDTYKVLHVLPAEDLEPHLESSACKCAPSVNAVEGGLLIIHNSYNGREFFEPDNQEKVSAALTGH